MESKMAAIFSKNDKKSYLLITLKMTSVIDTVVILFLPQIAVLTLNADHSVLVFNVITRDVSNFCWEDIMAGQSK